jgi:hypothetical protein
VLDVSQARDPERFVVCSLDGTKYTTACPPPVSRFDPPFACAVFHTSDADALAAKKYGLCIPQDTCEATAPVFPGGVDCYDGYGERLP